MHIIIFRLFPFPTEAKSEARQRWIKAVNRADPHHPWKLLDPSKWQRVCSEHFVDGSPSMAHPDPELKLGYIKTLKRKRIPPEERSSTDTSTIECLPGTDYDDSEMDVTHCKTTQEIRIEELEADLKKMTEKVSSLKLQNDKLKSQHRQSELELQDIRVRTCRMHKPLNEKLLINDSACSFYTGIHSLKIFNILHEFISPLATKRWRGAAVISTKVKRKLITSPKKFGPGRKLTSKEEFLFVLMKLRLGLVNKDLEARFGISLSLVSSIFTSWITAMDKTIGRLLLYWPSQEEILATKPSRYRHIRNLVSIIDCSEIFIEKPKNLDLQFMTWSNYKHHNNLPIPIVLWPCVRCGADSRLWLSGFARSN